MIFVATTADNDHAMAWYLSMEGAHLRRTIVPVTYDDLLAAPALPRATYCFADLELLALEQRAEATELWDRLAAQGSRLLNHPTRTLRRYDLLRTLHDSGRNRFTVHRPTDDLSAVRYPVFLRGEDDHDGRRTELLADRPALDDALGAFAEHDRARLLVVEFCDTADAHGVYRKYAAFVVGDAVLARHMMCSTDWQVKEADLRAPDLVREELDYVEANPDEAQLRELFELARVDYGRIDYSRLDGELQVWEINTNPTIVMPTYHQRLMRAPVRDLFAARLAPCWAALDARD
jgi:hypothetical protein